jgi:adenylate cyclase
MRPGAQFAISELTSTSARRGLRMASGLVLFAYIGAHLANHALGLVSLGAAEHGMEIAIMVWYSAPGTALLYGAAAIHFLLALWAVYERRTFRLPPIELIRIALGFTLPILLIGHAASTRLAYDLFGLSSDYSRVVSNLWATDAQWWQLGLMAPGWLHGCLGLHLAFNRRPLYRQLRFVLFGAALLLPVLSALGFVAMGRELAANPAAVAAAQEYLSPNNAAQRLAVAQWKEGMLNGYFAIIAAAFIAREIRNLFERRGNRLVAVSYPGRSVKVPRGWTVLEASRSFHLPHAAMCGGRARCSTCRVRISAGKESCPPPAADEQATLDRIGAAPDVRLACQLRPQGDISVVPLVRTARPIYRQTAPRRSEEREIVVLYYDVRNPVEPASDHLLQDVLHVATLSVEALGNAVRAARGTLIHVEVDTFCALFGLDGEISRATQDALRAAGAIASVISDLNERLERRADSKVKFSVSIHAGRAAVGEVGSTEPPTILAIGEAVDVAKQLRKLAIARDKSFVISRQVYAAAGLDPVFDDSVTIGAPGQQPVTVFLAEAAPVPSQTWTVHGERSRRASLRRMLSG